MQKRIAAIILAAVASGSILAGCASVDQKLDPNTFYKRDLLIEIGGRRAEGALVVPMAELHRINIESRGVMDLFTFTTCHRETSREKLGQKVQQEYRPVKGIEDGYCPVQLGGYEKKRGRHAWGYVDFETPDAKLPAELGCNGESFKSNGVSVCQSRAGLIQSITFPSEVRVSPSAGCGIPVPADKKKFTFPLPKGECVIAFMETSGEHRVHRLTTLGYEGILIREE